MVLLILYFYYVSNKVLIEPITTKDFIEYSKCSYDSDCVSAGSPECSRCGCGVYINKSNAKKYSDEISKMCENYKGSICGISACPKTQPSCKRGVCVGIARNYNILNHFIYRP